MYLDHRLARLASLEMWRNCQKGCPYANLILQCSIRREYMYICQDLISEIYYLENPDKPLRAQSTVAPNRNMWDWLTVSRSTVTADSPPRQPICRFVVPATPVPIICECPFICESRVVPVRESSFPVGSFGERVLRSGHACEARSAADSDL